MGSHTVEVNDEGFERDVLQSEQPVLVDFWAEWCAPCRAIAPAVERVAEQYAGRAKVVKVNVDENPDTSQRYGVKGIPTLILFSGGKEAERVVGAAGGDVLARLVEKHVGSAV
jgi:thioredoxin 1